MNNEKTRTKTAETDARADLAVVVVAAVGAR